MDNKTTIFWFRQDLRVEDNPGLYYAAQNGTVLPVYIHDPLHSYLGAASQWWLHHSLNSLNLSLKNSLNLYQGKPKDILLNLMKKYEVEAVYWNRCYESDRIAQDTKLKTFLGGQDVEAKSFNGSLLWEPWTILNGQKGYYKKFSSFYRNGCLRDESPRSPLPKPEKSSWLKDEHAISIDSLKLLPSHPWGKKLEAHWRIGEEAAHQKFDKFLETKLSEYAEGRNFPTQENVSRLSPHLHFGEISPHQLWHKAQKASEPYDSNLECFLSELGWREFSYYLLYHFPTLPKENFQKKFNTFPWRNDPTALKKWQKGSTGYPLVDAGMRELWQTGYMHNRVRMVVASFLVKNLLIHWHEGAAWFWECLVDADLANNSASWQWVAGCGTDAAPYFRIFNPTLQGEKFDPDGVYTKTFVPELAALPLKHLFCPWEAPASVLDEAGITLGETYPYPIVDLKASRKRALLSLA